MDPQRTLADLVARIRRKLWILHVFNPSPLHCAFCGKRVAAMRKATTLDATDGLRLCQSCFGLVLKKAAQAPDYVEGIVREPKAVWSTAPRLENGTCAGPW